jgi:hypothetical protein
MTGPFTFQTHRRTSKRGDQDSEGIPEVYDHMSCLIVQHCKERISLEACAMSRPLVICITTSRAVFNLGLVQVSVSFGAQCQFVRALDVSQIRRTATEDTLPADANAA